MFDTTSSPYKAWEGIGSQLSKSGTRGLVVVSAHWENGVNTPNVLGESVPIFFLLRSIAVVAT